MLPNFNLDDAAFCNSFDLDVKHPATGESSGWCITLAGPGHKVTLAAEEAEFQEKLAEHEEYQRTASKALKAGREVPRRITTVADFNLTRSKLIAARVLTSTPVAFNGNDALVLSPENAAIIIADPRFHAWLYPQLETALNDKANFISSSAKI